MLGADIDELILPSMEVTTTLIGESSDTRHEHHVVFYGLGIFGFKKH